LIDINLGGPLVDAVMCIACGGGSLPCDCERDE
jgi:hypothetical protein